MTLNKYFNVIKKSAYCAVIGDWGIIKHFVCILLCSPSTEDIVVIDSTTYDDPIQCAAMHSIPKEEEEIEKLDFHNPIYEALDYVARDYEVAVECYRPSSPMESAIFDDQIYG